MGIDIGAVVAGKYALVRKLGHGSMGEVWVARHVSLGENVAIKLLSAYAAEVEDAATASARFRFEAQIAARLSRKTRHIVRVTDHGEDRGLAYLIMELLEGETLDSLWMRRGPLDVAQTATIVAEAARGLAEAHAEGVIHRDLKPSNLFLARVEEGDRLVKILDFGIALAAPEQRLASLFSTAEGVVFGTPGYMSPEQILPSAPVDERCDLWALSTVAYEALTGELPFEGEHAPELLANTVRGRFVPVHARRPELPRGLADFFAAAFSRNVDERYSNAPEFARRFAAAAQTAGLAASRGPSPATPASRAVRKERTVTPGPTVKAAPMSRRPASSSSRRSAIAFVASMLSVCLAGAGWSLIEGRPAAAVPVVAVMLAAVVEPDHDEFRVPALAAPTVRVVAVPAAAPIAGPVAQGPTDETSGQVRAPLHSAAPGPASSIVRPPPKPIDRSNIL
jgi:eukaryotic-like serine/threonine-protein kinase